MAALSYVKVFKKSEALAKALLKKNNQPVAIAARATDGKRFRCAPCGVRSVSLCCDNSAEGAKKDNKQSYFQYKKSGDCHGDLRKNFVTSFPGIA